MNHLDIFAGIGGFSYAARRMNWHTVAFVEKEPFCQKVLRKNFGQDAEIHDDIFTFSGKPFRGRIDILTGGFPCQPFSQAGKRLGVNDERHLFPELLRVIREVQSTWLVLENVVGLTTMALEVRDVKVGCTKYRRAPDIDDYEAIYTREETMLLNRICEEIEREGYAVQPVIIPAVSLEADHERKRIWIVARLLEHAECNGQSARQIVRGDETANGKQSTRTNATADVEGTGGDVADASINGSQERFTETRRTLGRCESGRMLESEGSNCDITNSTNTRTARRQRQQTDDAGRCGCGSNLCGGCDGADRCSDALDALPDAVQGFGSERDGERSTRLRHRENVRRPANWLEAAARFCRVPDGPAPELEQPGARDNRVERLKALGNAVYWPVCFEIFKAIEDLERSRDTV